MEINSTYSEFIKDKGVSLSLINLVAMNSHCTLTMQ